MAQAPPAQPQPAGPPARRAGCLPRALRALGIFTLLLVLLGFALGLWLRGQVRASLPQLEGEVPLAGLEAAVRVERDSLGIPTLHAESRTDLARALGFVHAQDRFFQMDLLRRRAAGELGALVGPGGLRLDRAVRLHRFRVRARQALADATPDEHRLATAYAAGVNASLGSLGAAPVEYLALRVDPEPWKAEDCFLALYAMFLDLQGPGADLEATLGILHDSLPAPLFAFLVPRGTEWDSPLEGEALAMPPIPGPEVVDLRRPEPLPGESARPAATAAGTEPPAGSNAWALAGRRTARAQPAAALLANDMHLGLSVPNIWYRARLRWKEASGELFDVSGATLPGLPAVVVGSNGHVAWGLTNSRIDTLDLIRLEIDPDDPGRYLTPDGPEPFRVYREQLALAGGGGQEIEVRSTRWGPVWGRNARGEPLVLRWTAHDPSAVAMDLLDLATAHSVEEAIAAAHRTDGPALNLVIADAEGHIAWTLLGKIPRRVGFDGATPASWARGDRRWDGWLAADEIPVVRDPADGQLWSANHRMVGGAALEELGDGGYLLGARARQVRDRLRELDRTAATEAGMLALQLDDHTPLLERWQSLLLGVLQGEEWEELRGIVAGWDGRARADSVAYRLLHRFRRNAIQLALDPLLALAEEGLPEAEPQTGTEVEPELRYGLFLRQEGPAWSLMRERPLHLLDPQYASWDELLEAAARATLAEMDEAGPELGERTWGEINEVKPQHLLSLGVPALGRWLDMPASRLPGSFWAVRVQTPGSGASQRMVVAPGHEGEGIFHMPGGQSGHPLSPHYRDGHAAWADGEPTPLLPGKTVHQLLLTPAGGRAGGR